MIQGPRPLTSQRRSQHVFGCCHQGKPRTTTPQRTVRTASRAPTHCCAPGTASRPYWMCSGYRPSRALRRTVASHCASANQPCPSKITFKRGVTPSSKANQLFLRQYWPASPVSVHSGSQPAFVWLRWLPRCRCDNFPHSEAPYIQVP